MRYKVKVIQRRYFTFEFDSDKDWEDATEMIEGELGKVVTPMDWKADAARGPGAEGLMPAGVDAESIVEYTDSQYDATDIEVEETNDD